MINLNSLAFFICVIFPFFAQGQVKFDSVLNSLLTKHQVVMLVNDAVSRVSAPYNENELSKFQRFGSELSMAQVVFFGEYHGDKSGIDQMRALEFLVQPQNIILLEGELAGKPTYCGSMVLNLCIYDILRFFYSALQKATGESIPYTPEHYELIESWLQPIVLENLSQLKLNTLKISNAKCSFWDDLEAMLSFITERQMVWSDDDGWMPFDNKSGVAWLEPLTRRNIAMVSEIKKNTVEGRRVFIVAGLAHLPSGDLHLFQNHFRTQPDKMESWFGLTNAQVEKLNLSEYYDILEHASSDTARRYIENEGMGSTKVIFDYFKNEGIKYIELVPQAIMNRKD